MKWDAEKYDRVNIQQFESGMELIRLADVRKDDLILDLGCGTGTITAELAGIAPKGHVTGIDPSFEMIDRASERCRDINNVTFHNIPAQSMTFTDTFDLVYSNLALQWVKERHKVAGLIYQALKPYGRIAFQVPGKNFCPNLFDCIHFATRKLGIEKLNRNMNETWYLPGKKEYEIFLRIIGFNNVHADYKEYTLYFQSTEEVADWWSPALLPFMEPLDEKSRMRFRSAFAMNSEKYRNEKGIAFNLNRIFAFGEK